MRCNNRNRRQFCFYIYNSDLLDWAKDNYEYIEEATEEFGCPTKNYGGFIKQIQQGQYYKYTQELYDSIKDIISLVGINYILNDSDILEKLDENDIDNIIDEIQEKIDNNNKIEDIIEIVDNYIENL